MARYVDIDKLLEKTREVTTRSYNVIKVVFVSDIENIHTTDVVPAKHGKWIKQSEFSEYVCNKCGKSPKTIFDITTNYCPNCGAKMDSECTAETH